MFLATFLAAFKTIAFLILMFLTFLIGTIRQVLTAIVIIGLPLILMFSLLPFFKRITDRFIDALLGLLIAPIFSALVVVSGVAQLQTLVTQNPDPITEWFAALSVMALGTFMPVMIVPMLGSIISSVSSIATGAISTGFMVTGLGSGRSLGGFGHAVDNMIEPSTNSISLAKAAFSPPTLAQISKSGIRGAEHTTSSALEPSRGFNNVGKTAKFVTTNNDVSSDIASNVVESSDSNLRSSASNIFGIDPASLVKKMSYDVKPKPLDATSTDTISTILSTVSEMNQNERSEEKREKTDKNHS
jgi:hypothetical protein